MKLMSLPEAFRVILRDGYPSRPALADEIQSRHWFMYVTDKPTEEITAAKSAYNAIYSAIRDQRIRLKGCLGRDQPADIDPIEIERGNLDVLDGTLKVYNGAATLRTYTHLHCYEEEIKPLFEATVPETRARYLTEKTVVEFVHNYRASDPNPTMDGLRVHAKLKKIVGGRALLDREYRDQMKQNSKRLYRRGRRSKV